MHRAKNTDEVQIPIIHVYVGLQKPMGLQIPMVMPIQVQWFAPKSDDLMRQNLMNSD